MIPKGAKFFSNWIVCQCPNRANALHCEGQTCTCTSLHDLLYLIFLRSLKSEYFSLTNRCQVRVVLKEPVSGCWNHWGWSCGSSVGLIEHRNRNITFLNLHLSWRKIRVLFPVVLGEHKICRCAAQFINYTQFPYYFSPAPPALLLHVGMNVPEQRSKKSRD